MFDRTKVTMDIEKGIVALLVLNDDFCKQVLPFTRPEYFESKWAVPVVEWVIEHFHIYGNAPKDNIRQIFNMKFSQFRDEQDATGIQLFLDTIPDSYREVTDVEFHVNRATAYLKTRSLVVLRDTLSLYLDNNKYEAAEKAVMEFRDVATGFSKWLSPDDFISAMGRSIEANENPLFTYRGEMGRFIGPMQRKWVTMFLAPPKRGKSQFLVETALEAMTQNLSVAVFSHEMSDLDWIPRFIHAMKPGTEDCREVPFPVFDCYKNALNTCSKAQRKGYAYYDSNGGVSARYMPCTACKGTPDYDPCVGHQMRKTQEHSYATSIEKAAVFARWKKDKLRFFHYAPYSASILDMERDLMRLEYAEGLVPDIIVDDYIGAHACGNRKLEGRDVYNFEIQNAKRIADERNCLYIGAAQGNRGAINKRRMTQADIAEDIRIINAVDVCIAINQTPQEKHDGIIRLSIPAHRHKNMADDEELTILQNLETGCIVADSQCGYAKTIAQRQQESEGG